MALALMQKYFTENEPIDLGNNAAEHARQGRVDACRKKDIIE